MDQTNNNPNKPIAVEVEAGKTYRWCACGKSSIQPWCDGAHVGTGIEPVAFTADESKTLYFCGCKKTHHAPKCDGTHQMLSGGGRDAYYRR